MIRLLKEAETYAKKKPTVQHALYNLDRALHKIKQQRLIFKGRKDVQETINKGARLLYFSLCGPYVAISDVSILEDRINKKLRTYSEQIMKNSEFFRNLFFKPHGAKELDRYLCEIFDQVAYTRTSPTAYVQRAVIWFMERCRGFWKRIVPAKDGLENTQTQDCAEQTQTQDGLENFTSKIKKK